jgi:hypothetical protein
VTPIDDNMGSVFGSEARSDSDAWLADGVAPRVVVCAPGGARGLLELPESRLNPDHGTISGGERSLYEIATAAATLGLEVELRGEICPQILDRITQSAGAGPRVHLEPRAPMPGEIVIVPEAYDIELFAAISLSHARGVVMLLAPPGLWGWSFRSGWRPPDPNSVPVDAVGTPETFRAIDALGLSMWTHSIGVAHAAERAGVPVAWVGSGTAVPWPDPPEKCFDVAVIEANRWYEPAAAIAEQLSNVSVLRVPLQRFSYSLSQSLGPARVLLWPSRIEGASRISREARAVGTVPVALDTNPFATVEDHGEGVVLVQDEQALLAETRALLADPPRLQALAAAGAKTVREQEAWEPYVRRVGHAIAGLASHPGHSARGVLGDRIRHANGSTLDRLAAAGQESATARADLMAAEQALEAGASQLQMLSSQLEDRTERLEGDLAATAEELRRSLAEVQALRARLVVRLVDRTVVRRMVVAVRSLGRRALGPK